MSLFQTALRFRAKTTKELKLNTVQGFRRDISDGRYPRRNAGIRHLHDDGCARIVVTSVWCRLCPNHHTSSQRKIWPIARLLHQLASFRSFHPRCCLLIELWSFGCLSIFRRLLWRSLSCLDRRYLCGRMGPTLNRHVLLLPKPRFLRWRWLWLVTPLCVSKLVINWESQRRSCWGLS